MSYFNNLVLTTKGQEMLLSSNTNIEKIITFTNASLGSEKLSPEEIKKATEVKKSWIKIPLNTVRVINDENNYFLRTEIAFTNAGITENKIMRELGIYAKFETEEEILFAYSITDDDGETIPREDVVPATYKFTIDATISTETKINQFINPTGFLTKEVIELLKENIRNIGFRKIKGILNAGQKIIQVPTDILMPISERAILNIEGEIYFLGRDYTIDSKTNTITLKEPYRFNNDNMYEIIDPLPPTYVKEQIQEFIDEFKLLVSDSKVDFEALKERIFLEIQQKVDDFYTQLENYIEGNKENLKGHSIDRIIENGQDENGGNIYDIFRDDNRKIGTITAPKGNEGIGVIDIEYIGLTENGDTEYKQILSNGQRTEHTFISPKGQKGDSFYIKKVYPSIEVMKADFSNKEVGIGEYVIISSNDEDNAKLYEKKLDRFFFIVQMALKGKSAYEVWLELGNEGTEEDFINSFKGVGIKDKEFVREDEQGNYIYRDIYSDGTKSSEYISPRGPRGYTGGTAGEPQPPESIPFGTIIEWTGGDLPQGWLYTSGGILDKRRYPHMSFLPGTTQPQEPYFKISGATKLVSKGLINNQPTWEFNFETSTGKLYQDFVRTLAYHKVYFDDFLKNVGQFPYDGMTNKYYYINLPEKLALSFITMNKKNASGNSFVDSSGYQKNVDIYFDIEYMDDNGEWIKGVELHNKTDFIPASETTDNATAMIKSSFKSNKFRIIINNKSTPNFINDGVSIFYVGHVVFGFDKGGAQYTDYLQLPNEKDAEGRYKIIYVGQPLAPVTTEMTMFAYDNDKRQTREIPFSLAVENKLPSYIEGITMSEPQPLRIGYTNKYNNNTDTWELVRTHENQEGYYYDVNGDLKYIPKPYNWFKWDFETHTWIEDTLLKEEAKNELLNKYIELELKKDKILELKLSTENIEIEIEQVKKELEVFE